MKRREFLHAGAAAGIAAVSSGGCVLTSRAFEDFSTGSLAGLPGFLDGVDRTMDKIGQARLIGGLVPDLPADAPESERARWSEAEALARKSLRTLYLAGVVKELSPRALQHHEVQRRIVEAAPEMDEAVLGSSALLASASEGDRRAIQSELRRDPDLGLRISSELNDAARASGTTLPIRLKMRGMVTHLSWRMRVQSPSLLFDEYVDKARRVAVRSGPAEAIRRELAARLSEEAFWRHEERVATLVAKLQDEPGTVPLGSRPASRPAGALPPEAEPAPPVAGPARAIRGVEPVVPPEESPRATAERRSRIGRGMMIGGGVGAGVGAALLGIGGVLVGSAASLSGAWIGGAIMMTVGGVLVLAGLIVLIIGAVTRSRARAALVPGA
jgi:hypothetical protein